jgi:uncharacterized membrane protein YbaN (DUF454 family)
MKLSTLLKATIFLIAAAIALSTALVRLRKWVIHECTLPAQKQMKLKHP